MWIAVRVSKDFYVVWKIIKILLLRISISSKIFERMVSILVITKDQIIEKNDIKIGDHKS